MKKKYVVKFDDAQHGAQVARKGAETQVATDEGELVPVNFHPVFQGKAISIRHAGRLHLIHITSLDREGRMVATIAGRPVNLTVMDELRAQALDSLDAAGGGGVVSADIPGLVVEIKVEAGQIVHQGDPVIVVEAMKMQNELCAAVGGTVVSIPVNAGQAVNPGDQLVIIDPQPGG